MAEKKNKVWVMAFWAFFAIVLLGGVAYFAWTRTEVPAEETSKSTATGNYTCDKVSPILTETDELNENEVEFTACNFDEEVINSKGVVLIDAYASWCPHCQKLSPIIAQLANDYAGRAKIGKLNANNQDPAMIDNFNFARENGLDGYPTVWIYKDGARVETFSGERSYDEIKALLDKYL